MKFIVIFYDFFLAKECKRRNGRKIYLESLKRHLYIFFFFFEITALEFSQCDSLRDEIDYKFTHIFVNFTV